MITIKIPLWGDVNISEPINIEAIVSHPRFQILNERHQLGPTYKLFPGARHTRYEHSLGAFYLTRELMLRFYQKKMASWQDVVDTSIFALLHDVGHPVFSHTLEPLLERDHHLNGIEIIKEMEPALAAAGTSGKTQIAFMEKEQPLAEIVSNKHIGTEKIDYLSRDAEHTGYGGELDASVILSNLTFKDGKLLLLKRAFQEGIALVHFYQQMYERVYLTARSLYASRLVQKMYERLLETESVTEEELSNLTDSEFIGGKCAANDPELKALNRSFITNAMPRTSVIFCREPFAESHERRYEAGVSVKGLGEKAFEALAASVKWDRLKELESEIALEFGAPRNSVFVIPAAEPKRFGVPKIELLDGEKIVPLETVAPEIRYFEQTAERIGVIRVATDSSELQRALIKNQDKILELLEKAQVRA